MDRKPENWSRDELLGTYERGVWTFLALVALVALGFLVWLAYMIL